MAKKSKKELQVEQLDAMVKGVADELKSDWSQLSASCKNDDERERWEKILFPEPLTAQQKYEFCAVINENVRLGKEDNTIVNLAARWQAYKGYQYTLIGDAYTRFHRIGADSDVAFILGEDERRDMLIFIGSDATGMTRGFVASKEEGVDALCEINELCLYAIAEHPVDSDEVDIENFYWIDEYRRLNVFIGMDLNSTKEYIEELANELTINASMTADEYEAYCEKEAEAQRVKFIAEYGAKPMLPSMKDDKGCEDNNVPKRKRYDRQFKIAAVKYAKKSQLSVSQVAKELGVLDVYLIHWIHEYERLGENAFPGHRWALQSNQNIDTPVQSGAAEATSSFPDPDSATDATANTDTGTTNDTEVQENK